MPDSIKIGIISGFDETGANQAKTALNGVANAAVRQNAAIQASNAATGGAMKTMKAGAAGAAALSGALGSGQGGLATAARAASGGLNAFATGGIWAAVIAVGVSIVASLIEKFQRAKEAAAAFAKESRKAFDAKLLDIQKARLESITAGHKALIETLHAETKARNDLNAAADKTMAAEFRAQALNLKGGLTTALEGVTDPAERKKIELDYAQQIADVEREAAKIAAQSAENTARRKLESAKRELDLTRQQVKTLEGEQGRSKLGKEILKELEGADQAVAVASGEVASAEEELRAASLNLANVMTEGAIEQTQSAQAQMELQRQIETRERNARAAAAAEEQIASTEEALDAALREHIAASQAAAAATRKEAFRDRVVAGGADAFIGDRLAKREAAKDKADQLERDEARAANLHRKRNAGTKLSKRDSEWLNLFDEWEGMRNAGRVGAKAFDAEKNAQQQVNLLTQHLAELQGLRADILSAMTIP